MNEKNPEKSRLHLWCALGVVLCFLPEFLIGEPSVLRGVWTLAVAGALWGAGFLPWTRWNALPWSRILPGVLFLIWAGFSALSVLKYAHFGDLLARDAAYYDQIFRSATLGDGSWKGSILQSLFHDPPLSSHWAVHTTWIAWLVWPLYRLFPSLDTLLCVRNLWVVLSAWPLFALSRRHLDPLPSFLLSLAILSTPTLLYQHLNSFYFYPAAVPCFLWAWYGHESNQKMSFFLGALGLLSVREDMGIAVAALGTLAAWESFRSRGDEGWGRVAQACFLAAFGAIWWISSAKWIMPRYGAAAGAATMSWYAGWGGSPGEMLSTLLNRPDYAFSVLFSPVKTAYVWQLLRSSGGVGVLALPALIALPYLAINMLVTRPQAATAEITYHYSLLIIAAMFAALPRVIARFAKKDLRKQMAWVLWVLALNLSTITTVYSKEELKTLAGRPEVSLFREIISHIPPDNSSVAAPSRLLTGFTSSHTELRASDRPMGYTSMALDWVVLAEDPSLYDQGDWTEAEWREFFERFRSSGDYERIFTKEGYSIYRRVR